MDSESTEQRQALRRKRTLYWIVGGVLSLLLPLLGALYLKLSEISAPAADVDASAIFARRDGTRLQPAGAPAAPASAPGTMPAPVSTPRPGASAGATESGLSMIRGGQDYYPEAQVPAAAAILAPAAAPKPVPIPQPSAAKPLPPAPPAKQPFSFAKLKPASGFGTGWFSSNQSQTSAQTAAQPGAPQAAGAGVDINALINSMRGAGAGAGAQAPDVGSLLKNVPNPPAGSSSQH